MRKFDVNFTVTGVVAVMLLVLFPPVAQVARSEAPPVNAAAVADSYIRCAAALDPTCGLDLFHIPGTPGERETDRRFLEQALALFGAEFGKAEDAHPTQQVDAAFVSAGGGTLPYWQTHQQFRRFQFLVRFEREGTGFIIVDVCEISGRPEIRQVQYGLPTSRADTQRRLAEILRKLQSFDPASAA